MFSRIAEKRLTPGLKVVRNLLVVTMVLCLQARYQTQVQISLTPTTACPNQIVTVTATWPNVSITSLSITIPAGASCQGNGNITPTASPVTFTISHPGPGPNTNWVCAASGTSLSGAVTSTVNFQLNIQAPAPLTITQPSNGVYCPGNSATISAPAGAFYYTITGQQNLGQFSSNVMIIPNLNASHSGTYLVTSVGSCTATGVTTIAVAPNNQIAVNQTSNVCEHGNVSLTGNMAGATGWNWVDQYNITISSPPYSPGQSFCNFTNVSPSVQGKYTVYANYGYATVNGSVSCPRSATTQINVVPVDPVHAVASPANMLCQGDKLSLNTQGAANAVSFTWKGPCGFGPTSSASPTISPVGQCNSGSYTVTALFTNNYTTCPSTDSVRVFVVATAAPNAVVPPFVCQGGNAQLVASSSMPAISYNWNGPNFTQQGASVMINSIQPDKSGPYIVTAVYQGVSSLGTKQCSVSSTAQQLTVIQVNSVSVIPSPPVCAPDNAYLASSAPGAGSYQWAGPNNQHYSGANVTIYYPTPAATGIYTVTAYFGSLNCPNTNTVQLTVNPRLDFSLTPIQSACIGNTLIVNGPPGATSYSWTSSTGYTGFSKDLYIDPVQINHSGSYTLEVKLGQCRTTASTQIVVHPAIVWTLTPDSRTICKGDTVVLEAGLTGGTENYAYEWNPPLYLDGPTGPYKVTAPQGSVQYNLKAWDLGCPTMSLSHVFDVKVNSAPQPELSIEPGEGCEPFPVKLYSHIDPNDLFVVTYDLGGNKQYQMDTTVTLAAGVYNLTVTTRGTSENGGCMETFNYPYPIIVHASPGADIVWSPEEPTTNDEVTFSANYKNEIVYYSWIFNGGIPKEVDTTYIKVGDIDTSSQQNPARKYEVYGKYPVMLTSTNIYGCTETVIEYVQVIDEMNLYIPNTFTPNGDGLNDLFLVKGQGFKQDGFYMELFNRKGQSFFSTKDIEEGWDGKVGGKPAPVDVYTYKIRAVGANGEGRKDYIGHVTLLR